MLKHQNVLLLHTNVLALFLNVLAILPNVLVLLPSVLDINPYILVLNAECLVSRVTPKCLLFNSIVLASQHILILWLKYPNVRVLHPKCSATGPYE